MRAASSLLLLGSSVFPTVIAQIGHTTDAQLTVAWESSGVCAYYYEKPGKRAPLADTCIKYCDNNGGHGFSMCDRFPYKDFDLPKGIDQSIIGQDEAGDVFVPCKCKCEDETVEGFTKAVLDIVIEGLSQLDNIICAVMVETFKTILEVGIMFVPGGAPTSAAMRFVQGAKSFVENGLEAADFFGNWVGKACGVPDWNFDLFGALVGAPDSFGTSIGCKKKNKSECKKVDPVPDPPKPSKKPDDPPKSDPPPPPPSKTPETPPSSAPETPPSSAPETPPSSVPEAPPSSAPEQPPSSTPANSPSDSAAPPSNTAASPTSSPSLTTTSNPSASTSSGDPSSSTSSSADSCSTASGTQSGAACQETASPCKIKNPEKAGDDGSVQEVLDAIKVISPILNLGGNLGLRDGHRSPRRVMMEMRADKPKKSNVKNGKPCAASNNYKDWYLNSDEYPQNGELDAKTPSWGFEDQDSLCEWKWQDGKDQIAGNDYHSEHVMEWQVVTDFFVKMQAKGGTNYDHPDPGQAGTKVDFCTYWIESWSLEPGQEFAVNGSVPMTTWSHLAGAYPSKVNNKAEMVRLQDNINTPAKANLFTDKIEYVWTAATMDKQVNTNRDKVLERMRLLIGAGKYLQAQKIRDIFKAQKERMGAILDQLDTDMQTHVREKVDPVTGTKTSYTAWTKQDLLTEWNTYMDTKWSDATAKYAKVLNKYVNDLDDKHCQSRNKKSAADQKFCDRLRKLQTEYASAKVFTKPW